MGLFIQKGEQKCTQIGFKLIIYMLSDVCQYRKYNEEVAGYWKFSYHYILSERKEEVLMYGDACGCNNQKSRGSCEMNSIALCDDAGRLQQPDEWSRRFVY